MRRIILGFVAITFVAMAAGCASTPEGSPMAAPGEKLIWSSENPRPDWTIKEPEGEGSYMFFVGLSGDVATEQLSRNDAYKNSTKRVIQYIGTLAKDKYERKLVSFGLAADVTNPTQIQSDVEKQVAAAASKNLKAMKWYLEKWEKPTGISWKTFVMARIPKSSLDNSFTDAMNNEIRDAQKKQKEANDEIAKRQLEKYLDMLRKLKEEGLTTD